MRFRAVLVVAIAALAMPGAVFAQSAPPAMPQAMPQAMPRRVVDSAFALGAAYRQIWRAEQAGATGHYVDAARTHYRSAIDRRGRNDEVGAAAEARLADDLARVAIDERPPMAQTGPKDIPAPPTPRPVPGRPEGPPALGAPGPGGPAMEHVMRIMTEGPMGPGREPMIRVIGGDGMGISMRHHGFDATALAEILKVETSAEARQLAQNSVDANSAAQKAALAGNVAEASRQSRISSDLAAALHDLAVLNHPELARRMTIEHFMSGHAETRP